MMNKKTIAAAALSAALLMGCTQAPEAVIETEAAQPASDLTYEEYCQTVSDSAFEFRYFGSFNSISN